MSKKKRGAAVIRVRTYAILDRAVEEGVRIGWDRAHKHSADPDRAQVEERVHEAVMGAICEVLAFDDDDTRG